MTDQGIIVGDVGGTNTRLGVVLQKGGAPTAIATYRNVDFLSFEKVLAQYLHHINARSCAQIYLAVAAPIDGEKVALTNCDWVIDRARLRQVTGAKTIHLLNDLEALACALIDPSALGAKHVAGPTNLRADGGRMLVIGAGTGFNAASLMPAPAFSVQAAECGHMSLPVETAEDLDLRAFLAQGRGRASVERAISGQGLCEIHHWAARGLGLAHDPLTARQITERALQGSDAACAKAAQTVLRLLAIVAGDLALAYLPHGGIYLAGSVCRALYPMMAQAGFAEGFCAKGRQTNLLRSFPIKLITNDAAALIGCAALANRQTPSLAEHAE